MCKLAVAVLVLAFAQGADARSLNEARVSKIINEVAVVEPATGTRAAKLHELVKEQSGVKTGPKSRSELLFEDKTLVRIGPKTFLRFTAGTREMTLQEGTMLLQVPNDAAGAKIRGAEVTAATAGTTMMLEHRPAKHLKVLVLEGSVRLSVNGRFGDSLLLTPGKMVIMPANADRVPDPVAVDIAHVAKTSSLVTMSKVTVPSIGLIRREIDLQARAVAGARLIPTNLVISGAGTNVTVTDVTPVEVVPAGGR